MMKEIANILNKNFQDVFVREDESSLPLFDQRTSEIFSMTSEDFKNEDIFQRLENLNESKSCGADNLHPLI